MKLASSLALVLALAGPLSAAQTTEKSEGLEATITDTYDFKMNVNHLTFKMKADPAAGASALKLDHIPILSGGNKRNLWLAQVATAKFSAKSKGQTSVEAVLQGQGDQVTGVVENTARCFFDARIGRGERKGRRVRFPLAEVKRLEIHTPYEAIVGPGKMGKITPMPGPNEDVVWVSSVPLGAPVFAKPLGGREAIIWREYKRLGTTPLRQKLAPGKYAVRVFVPAKLAAKLRPATRLGEDASPFEPDGWGELNFRRGANVVESMTYTVVKRQGEPATLISLFQRKGLELSEVVGSFPKAHNFHFLDKKLEGVLLYQKVPKRDIPAILEALHRGGKIIWHGAKQSLMIELKPGERGWKITPAIRPKKK